MLNDLILEEEFICIKVVTSAESMPPDKKTPKGTSDTVCLSITLLRIFSTFCTASDEFILLLIILVVGSQYFDLFIQISFPTVCF